MKLAYLILAHNAPEQLSRLVDAINGQEIEIFIHIDKKSDINPFLQVINKAGNIHFIKNRVNVFWRGYSIVQATLNLMEEARYYDVKYNLLISGSDYPIKSNQHITKFLSEANSEFISFFRLADRPNWLKKIEHYYYWESKFLNPTGGVHSIRWRYRKWHKKLSKALPKRKFLNNMVPYGGSGWWMLTSECVDYVLDYVKQNKSFQTFYKYTDAPDEMVFQSIILNSPYASKVINWERYQNETERKKLHATWPCPASVYNYRYIDWSLERMASPGHPVVLDECDFNLLADSHCIIARKVDAIKSSKLLDMIDSEIIRSEHAAN